MFQWGVIWNFGPLDPWLYKCRHICTYTHTHTHTHPLARAHIYTRTHTYSRTHTHAHTHAHTYTHALVRTHTHTHTHYDNMCMFLSNMWGEVRFQCVGRSMNSRAGHISVSVYHTDIRPDCRVGQHENVRSNMFDTRVRLANNGLKIIIEMCQSIFPANYQVSSPSESIHLNVPPCPINHAN
jgi:hypothetical protein